MKNVEIDEKTIINYTKTIAKRYCFDGFFKTVLTQKTVLRDMILEFVLDVSDEVTQLLPNEKPKIYANEKGQIYDIFLEDKMKNQYVIEMQSRNCSKNGYTRFSNYACSLFSSQFKKSDSYNNSKSIHVIVFNNSNTSKENLLIEGYHLFEETNHTDYPVNVIGIYYINTKHLDQMLSHELSMRDLAMYQLIHLFRYDEVDHNFEVPKIIKEAAKCMKNL